MNTRLIVAASVVVLSLGFGGCMAKYATPGRAADMSAFTAAQAKTPDGIIREAYAAEPLAMFPASVAVVRVQAPGYENHAGASGYGTGRYSVVTMREVETDDAMARITALPGVSGLAWLNRLLIPSNLTDDRELRAAAAGLRADLLLVYTFDTRFDGENFATPLAIVSLGIFPTRVENVKTTASAILIDTRTGLVHAAAEGNGDAGQLANLWTSSDAADDARKRSERRAFEALVAGFEKAWPGVLAANTGRGAPIPGAAVTAGVPAAGMVK
jgi:hypothetical protein